MTPWPTRMPPPATPHDYEAFHRASSKATPRYQHVDADRRGATAPSPHEAAARLVQQCGSRSLTGPSFSRPCPPSTTPTSAGAAGLLERRVEERRPAQLRDRQFEFPDLRRQRPWSVTVAPPSAGLGALMGLSADQSAVSSASLSSCSMACTAERITSTSSEALRA